MLNADSSLRKGSIKLNSENKITPWDFEIPLLHGLSFPFARLKEGAEGFSIYFWQQNDELYSNPARFSASIRNSEFW